MSKPNLSGSLNTKEMIIIANDPRHNNRPVKITIKETKIPDKNRKIGDRTEVYNKLYEILNKKPKGEYEIEVEYTKYTALYRSLLSYIKRNKKNWKGFVRKKRVMLWIK